MASHWCFTFGALSCFPFCWLQVNCQLSLFLPGLMLFVLKLKIIKNMCKEIITTYCIYYIFDFGFHLPDGNSSAVFALCSL